MKLFPAESVVFARAANIADLRDRLSQSTFGKMLSDPEIAPLVTDVVDTAKSRFDEQAAQDAGFDSTDLEKLPAGEAALALVDSGATELVVMVLLDFGENAEAAPELLDKLLTKAETDGATVVKETRNDDELVVIRPGDDADRSFGYVVRDGCMVGSNDQPLLEQLLDRWDAAVNGTPPPAALLDEENPDAEPIGEQTLAENPRFVAILRECSTQLSEPPQALFYVDPLQIARVIGRENGGLRFFLAILPALGLDGLQAIGGTVSLATAEWDLLFHAHVLLENPRAGVINIVRFRETDHSPPSYLPADTENYASTAVEPVWLFEEIAKLYDNFRYEGALRDAVKSSIDDNLEMEMETDLLPFMTGRMTTATSYPGEESADLGQQRVLGFEFSDVEVAKKVMTQLKAKFEDGLREAEYGGTTFWTFGPQPADFEPEADEPADGENRNRRRRGGRLFGPPTPAAAIVGNSLLVSTSHDLLKRCIDAEQGTVERLADDIEFRLVQSRIDRMTRGRQLSLLQFLRPEQAMRYSYQFIEEGTVGEFLTESEDATAMEFGDVLERNELPPFGVLAKYLAPGGAFLMDTDSGFHYMAFLLRRDVEE